MDKINLPLFYELGSHLQPLVAGSPTAGTRMDFLTQGFQVQIDIKTVFDSFESLNVCRGPADQLIEAIVEWRRRLAEIGGSWEEPDAQADTLCNAVVWTAAAFQTVLSAELHTLAAYHVTQKGIYSTPDLIEHAERALPDSVQAKIGPEVVEEIQQSGKCLAFDNATASGFHMMRATECVLHQFYLAVCEPEDKKRLPNWGAYIAALKEAEDPTGEKVITLIQQVKDQDRNLIMHPELVLTADEAFTLFEVGQSVIMAMAPKLPARKK